jgi:hypothetical protein
MRIKRWPYRFTTAALVLLVACGSPKEQSSTTSAPKSQYPTGTLDQMLAPIALYPDPLLAQILMSAGEPAKVTELHKWLQSNQKLKGTALQDAAVKAGFDPSFVALAIFPQVVAKMAEQIAWTTLLGQTFSSDRNAVFASVQKLRQQAKNVGTLKSTPQQDVETRKTDSGQEVIVIEPANPQIVYVPQYNTQVVYTQAPSNPAPPASNPAPASSNTTVIVEDDDDDAEVAIAAGLIGFTAGVVIGASMNNGYYYGPYGWHGGGYMYAEAWDDYYDHREDAREDWMDHREDLVDERSDRLEDRSEQRTDRSEQRTDRRESTQGQRTERQQTRQENRPDTQAQAQRTQRSTQAPGASAQSVSAQNASARSAAETARANRTGSPEARGYGDGSRSQSATPRSTGSSDAFSGYSSGASQRSASSRGQQSRSSSSRSTSRSSSGARSGGGRRR